MKSKTTLVPKLFFFDFVATSKTTLEMKILSMIGDDTIVSIFFSNFETDSTTKVTLILALLVLKYLEDISKPDTKIHSSQNSATTSFYSKDQQRQLLRFSIFCLKFCLKFFEMDFFSSFETFCFLRFLLFFVMKAEKRKLGRSFFIFLKLILWFFSMLQN